MARDGDGRTGTSQSLERGLAILSSFSADRRLIGVSEVAQELRLTRSTAHRYIATLAQLGYLQQDPLTRKYVLGPRVLELGFTAINSMELRDVAAPHLRRLCDETGHTVNMAILDLSDEAYVVMNPTVPTVLGTARLLETLARLGVPTSRQRLVLNENHPSVAAALGADDVTARLDRSVDHVLPYEKRLVTAVNTGAPLALQATRFLSRGWSRALERLTQQHDAYRWILGGVTVNHHSLSDFRVQHGEFLDGVLTHSVAVLLERGLVTLKRVSQDGVRIRASAGAASFRREPSLKRCLQEAQEQVQRLREELEEDPEATSRRQAAARQRAAEDRQRRVKEALEQLPKVAASKRADEQDQARVSTTDAEARVMKMADGGFRPAYNGQFAVDTETQIVVGVDVSNRGSDQGQLVPMLEQLQERYEMVPSESLVDGSFAGLKDIEKASELGTVVYAPVAKPKDATRDPHVPLKTDSPAIARWRERMGTPAAKTIYKQRASSVECVNALARQRGLQRLLVRGLHKARAVLLWYAIAHNLMRTLSLGASCTSPA